MTKINSNKPATTNPTPCRGGLAGTMVTTNAETWEALEDGLATKNPTFNMNLFARTFRTAYVFHGDDVHPQAEEAFNQTATLVGIKGFKPTDPVEAMIAAQAVMMHNLPW
ncbi:MAG: hypothetical protein ACRYGP_02715 [Janthinobacterium lividum]